MGLLQLLGLQSAKSKNILGRVLKRGTRAPNKVYVYADGTVQCSGEDVNGDVLCAENGPRDFEFPERLKGIGGLLHERFS